MFGYEDHEAVLWIRSAAKHVQPHRQATFGQDTT